MNLIRSVSLASVIMAASTLAWAAQDDPHQGHHPPASEPAAASTESSSVADDSGADMARMDAQIEAMRDMHSKMMAARTPEERSALMAEHGRLMHDGMGMMDAMASKGMVGMPMMGAPMHAMAAGDMAACHQMMDKRMQMMQAMMQMMMDRLPASAEEPAASKETPSSTPEK
jgi:hypothetical protein